MQQRCKDIYDINLKLNHRENHIHLVGRGCVITQTEKGAPTGLSIWALKKKLIMCLRWKSAPLMCVL